MLYKGKRDGYYLYELTDTDLIWEEEDQGHYCVGNVLLFANKKNIALGLESVKADDMATAIKYLEGDVRLIESTDGSLQDDKASLADQLAKSEAKIQWLDGLLHDLTEDLESQRYSNELLIAQMQSLREQISIERISRDEIIGDLEIASAETYRIDKELQKTIDAKTRLEQELAERICELLELDSANLELQKRLESQRLEVLEAAAPETGPAHEAESGVGPPFATESASSPTSAPAAEFAPAAEPELEPGSNSEPGLRTASGSEPKSLGSALSLHPRKAQSKPEAQVFATSTGKLIQVYHEFPDHRNKARRCGVSALQGIGRTLGLLLLTAVVFLFGSIAATAHLNGLSLGEALDMTLKALLPCF